MIRTIHRPAPQAQAAPRNRRTLLRELARAAEQQAARSDGIEALYWRGRAGGLRAALRVLASVLVLLLAPGCVDGLALKGSTLSMTNEPGVYWLTMTISGAALPLAQELLNQQAAAQAERLKCRRWTTSGLDAKEVAKLKEPKDSKPEPDGEEPKMETKTEIKGWLRCEG